MNLKTKTIIKAVALVVGGATLGTLLLGHPIEVVLAGAAILAYVYASEVADEVAQVVAKV